ncbi:hypothetical protein [Cobetia sp. Ld8]|uniref:hypothetical protein n=1 Tax=Cobetia sp. Ld8 TaxID=649154 RepID=UPI00386E3FE5
MNSISSDSCDEIVLRNHASYIEDVESVIEANEKLTNFWGDSAGWAPDSAFELLSKSRLDWQVELSATLRMWNFKHNVDGQLILAWANLGALIEGTLKLFLSVYRNDYSKDEIRVKRNEKTIDPDTLSYESLKLFFKKKEILSDEWIEYLSGVQLKRNAIHAYKHRDIGSVEDFHKSVSMYLEFLFHINDSLPYPEGYGCLLGT